jgi:hypothetical protein
MHAKCDLCNKDGLTYFGESWLCYDHWKERRDGFVVALERLVEPTELGEGNLDNGGVGVK